MLTRICSAAALTFFSFCANAQADSFWQHNGSVMELRANGDKRQFLYWVPRDGLPVSVGTVLFDGRMSPGGEYSGTAYVFSSKCGSAEYRVSGMANDRLIVLNGRVPRRNNNCRVTGHSDDQLVFTFSGNSEEEAEAVSPAVDLVVGRDVAILHADNEIVLKDRVVRLDAIHPEDPGHDGEIVVGVSGLSPNPFNTRRSVGLMNAFAMINSDGTRMIVYDPRWFGGVTSYATRYLVLGHEVGHHMCGHTIGLMREAKWERELEADTFAGAAMKRMRQSLSETIQAAHEVLPSASSASHPPLDLRVRALEEGYNNGSKCSGLDIVKPRVITEDEQAEFERSTGAWCTELLHELCRDTDTATMVWRYGLISGSCGIPPVKVIEGKVYFPGATCSGGARFLVPFKFNRLGSKRASDE